MSSAAAARVNTCVSARKEAGCGASCVASNPHHHCGRRSPTHPFRATAEKENVTSSQSIQKGESRQEKLT